MKSPANWINFIPLVKRKKNYDYLERCGKQCFDECVHKEVDEEGEKKNSIAMFNGGGNRWLI